MASDPGCGTIRIGPVKRSQLHLETREEYLRMKMQEMDVQDESKNA